MQALIAELEAATEGGPELDGQIAETQGWTVAEQSMGDNISEPLEFFEEWTEPVTNALYCEPPPYTTSLDAALTLVPEGWCLASLYDAVEPIDRPWVGAVLRRDEPYKILKALGAKTYALALCIATLCARQATKENG